MIADDGSPVLMDFGSTIKARIEIRTRQQALLEQVSEPHLAPWREIKLTYPGYCERALDDALPRSRVV